MINSYLKVALRSILNQKFYTLINVFGLAVGLACSILIFIYVQNELGYDSYHQRSDRIYRLERQVSHQGRSYRLPITAHPMGPALQADFPEIEKAVRFQPMQVLMRDQNQKYLEKDIFFTDASVFEVFDFNLLHGEAREVLNRPNTIVLTADMALRIFGEDDPLGGYVTMMIDGKKVDFEVTGIMDSFPANSHFHTEVLASYRSLQTLMPQWLNVWIGNSTYTYLLLKEQTDTDLMNQKLRGTVKKYMSAEFQKYFGPDMDVTDIVQLKLRPLRDIHLKANLSQDIAPQSSMSRIYIFSAIAVLVLLIASINYMNLTTARSAGRTREVGIRKTLGAERSSLFRRFISESYLVTALGLAFALFIVEVSLPYFNMFLEKQLTLSYFFSVKGSLQLIILFALVGFLSGSYPALYLSGFEPVRLLRSRADITNKGKASFLRQGLVILQFSISVALIVSTLVVMDQMQFMRDKELGFQKERVLFVDNRAVSDNQQYERFRNALAGNTNILGIATTAKVPGNADFGDRGYKRSDRPDDDWTTIRNFSVDEDFVPTLKVQIVAGRNFSREYGTDGDNGFLVNETAVKRLGFDKPADAVGQIIHRSEPSETSGFVSGRIIGVMKDFHFRSLHFDIDPLALTLSGENNRYMVIRLGGGDLSATLKNIEEIWTSMFKAHTFQYHFMDSYFDRLYRSEQNLLTLFRLFSFLAIVIACLGLFGLASYTAERRTKEIGVRKILGASVTSVVVLLSREFTRWVIIATVIAWPLSWLAMSRWLEDFAYRIDLGWSSFVLAGLIALLIALITVSSQAVRAASSNPARALRYE